APGGMGKTRLTVEVARRLLDEEANPAFADGICFVPLQPINTADLIPSAIANALNLQFYPGAESQQQIADYFRRKRSLLILDNFEHLLDGVGMVSELLAYAPALKVLVSSREALNLQEEWLYPLKGMSFPALVSDPIEEYSAVNLF